jgi:hypothetical protein
VAAIKIPDPYNMTKAEFLNPRPPKARSGYQLLYHTTSNDAARDIARNGLLTRYSKSPPKGTIWASTKPDDFYGSGGRRALITFQVPKRGTPADQDPYNGVEWDMGNSVVITRDTTPEDIVDIDLYYSTDLGSDRLSWFRGGSRYAETYWDEWFGPRQKGKTAYRFASGYGEGHMPSDEGPPAHDLLEDGEGFAPPDILDNPHYYTAFKSQLRSFWPTILKAQGKPGARIKVYRALPSQYDEFNRGDWVTLSYGYAKDHADLGNVSGEDAHVIEATVPASTVRWAGDDLMEWGYFGPTVMGKSRTASTRKTAARPIRLPTREIKTLAKRLAQRLYQYGLPKPGRVTAQEYLPLTNVMGDEVVVEILLTGTPGRNRDPFSNELLNGGFLKRRPEGPVMRVFVNPHLDPPDV